MAKLTIPVKNHNGEGYANLEWLNARLAILSKEAERYAEAIQALPQEDRAVDSYRLGILSESIGAASASLRTSAMIAGDLSHEEIKLLRREG